MTVTTLLYYISDAIYVYTPALSAGRYQLPEHGEMKSLTHPQGAPRGLLLHYMLRKIAQSPCHGYEILQDIDSKTEGAWRPGAGSIYPILKKLVTNGYIKANEGTRGVDRKVYSITPKGLESIKEDE